MDNSTIGLAADQVDRAGRGRPELGVVGIVVQRVVLGVVPQRRDRVSVVVVHDDPVGAIVALVGERRLRAAATGGVLDELVHEAHVIRGLLGRVAVVLVTGHCLRAVQACGQIGVRVGGQQRVVQAVDVRSTRSRLELRLVGRVGGVGVGAEVVVERDVLVEQHDHVLDRGTGLGEGGRRRRGRRRHGEADSRDPHRDCGPRRSDVLLPARKHMSSFALRRRPPSAAVMRQRRHPRTRPRRRCERVVSGRCSSCVAGSAAPSSRRDGRFAATTRAPPTPQVVNKRRAASSLASAAGRGPRRPTSFVCQIHRVAPPTRRRLVTVGVAIADPSSGSPGWRGSPYWR